VVKAPHQGSSIGVAFVKKDSVDDFVKAVKQCLFIREVSLEEWNSVEHQEFVQRMANLDEGIGLPVSMNGEINTPRHSTCPPEPPCVASPTAHREAETAKAHRG